MSQTQLQQIFEEQIEAVITKPNPTQKEIQGLMLPVAAGVLNLARVQREQSREIYGNGVPGGIKEKIQVLEILKSDVADIKKHIQNKPVDKIDSAIRWFGDKVLPALVISFIFAGINIVFIVMFFIFAWQNGFVFPVK